MKLIYEHNEVQGEVVEELNEATQKSSKSYYITGTFSTIGEKNRNGRIYPKHIWESEVSKYQNEINSNSINTLMEWEHPERTYVDPLSAVAKIVDLKIVENKVVGKAKLLNNEKANQLKNLIDEGISIGVSSRGVGSVGKNGMVENFKLITYDCVAQPSDFNANTQGLTEGHIENGILMTENFDITEDGKIIKVCGKEKCILENKENIEKAVIEKFEQLFKLSESEKNIQSHTKQQFISTAKSTLELIDKLADIADKAVEDKILDDHKWFTHLINFKNAIKDDLEKLKGVK